MRLLLGWMCFFSFAASATSEIVVRAHNLIQHGTPVVLGDIIEGTGVDKVLWDKLANVPMAAAPAVGEKLVFSSSAISSYLRAALAEVNKGNPAPHMRIPSHVSVERASHQWEQAVIEKELIEHWMKMCEGCKLELERVSIPPGTYESWTLKPKNDLPRGGFSVSVDVIKDGQPASLWVQGSLVVKKSVPVAKRAIYFGERIQTKDIEWVYRDVTFAQDGVPKNEDVVAHRVKQPVRANDIIFAGLIEHEKAVHRGEVTRVISGRGDYEVSISAVAQQDADIGDSITVKNTKTNKDFTGVVTAAGEVEIR